MYVHRSWARTTSTLALLTAAMISGRAAVAADLTVVVTNLKSASGTIRVGVYKDPATFPKVDDVLVGKVVPGVVGTLTLVFNDLPPGDYAVSAFHDLDDNGKLNRNLFGVPSEPYGFSRDARNSSGPPSFEDAKFTLGAGGARITFGVK